MEWLKSIWEKSYFENEFCRNVIDISHVTDEAFYQVIEISRAPVIASHSSPRKFTQDSKEI